MDCFIKLLYPNRLLWFWVRDDVNPLYVILTHVSLVLYLSSDAFSKDPTNSL